MTAVSPFDRRAWNAGDGNFEAYTSDTELYKNFDGIEWMRFILGETGAPQAWILRFPPNTRVGRHYHEAHRLEIVISGEFTYADEQRTRGPGSITFFPGGVKYGPLVTGDETLVLIEIFSDTSKMDGIFDEPLSEKQIAQFAELGIYSAGQTVGGGS
jgi:quercetin dioxygenase-like cupin family protein